MSPADALAAAVRAAVPRLRALMSGEGDDPEGARPRAALAELARLGAQSAVLPLGAGGAGLATDPAAVPALAAILRRLGRADLSLARLYEGHVNAVLLVEVHAESALRDRVRAAVEAGALLGVWGADGDPPLVREGARLAGTKRFASGLGLVTHALVTARTPEGAQLVLVPADDPARQRPEAWTASAMRASRSGGFDATDLPADAATLVGPPGALLQEPHFEGGVWRYCAAHVGGAEALVAACRAALAASGRLSDPVQRARLGAMLAAVDAARAVTEAAAATVTAAGARGGSSVEHAVARALLARESVERHCTEILSLAERTLGTAAHDGAGEVDRLRRDLSLFLRQAAPDAKLDRAVATLCDAPDPEEFEAW